jgi:hypothetical protein
VVSKKSQLPAGCRMVLFTVFKQFDTRGRCGPEPGLSEFLEAAVKAIKTATIAKARRHRCFCNDHDDRGSKT